MNKRPGKMAKPKKVQVPDEAPALLQEKDILALMIETVRKLGVIGEERFAKLVYLACVSRLMERQLSVVAKAQSSAGKSWTAGKVLLLFNENADYIKVSSMSPKALAYADDLDLKHKTLFIGEASGIGEGDGASVIRQLVSEGRYVHWTVIDGYRQALTIEGPINLVITTTAFVLDAETETRVLEVPLDESKEQTRAILKIHAARAAGTWSPDEVDLEPWHAVQQWLSAHGVRRAVLPFAPKLVEMIPPVALRLRRDINTVISLVSAHAILHQATRARDSDGRIVATLDDYRMVRELVADLISDSIEVTVKKSVREVVEAVQKLSKKKCAVLQSDVAKSLGKDKGNVSRSVGEAISKNYLYKNRDDGSLSLGEALPDGATALCVLPEASKLYELCLVVQGKSTTR